MKDSELYLDIIETYKETKSVLKTASLLGTNSLRVRRVLITEGLWHSKASDSIVALHKEGLSVSEIASRLTISEKNVQSYLPYTKGMYTEGEKSNDSVRSKRYRNRMNMIADQQPDVQPSENFIEDTTSQVTDYNGQHPLAIKIRLNLNIDSLTPQQLSVLKEYGSVEQGISRDIIVPADITLHALHYAIQALFGWENSHLHHYSFPDDVFEKITQNKVSRWCSLCGIYFRFPTDDYEDQYWDDRYTGNISFKNWLKRKYKGPYIYRGRGEYYLENQIKVSEFKEELPEFKVLQPFGEKKTTDERKRVSLKDATINELTSSIELDGEINHLLERLTLLDYLYLPDDNKYFLESIDNRIRLLEYDLESMIDHWNKLKKNVWDNNDSIYMIAQLTTVRMQAQSNLLNYFYDNGDGWNVEITCTEVYYDDADCDETVRKVIETHAPICVSADGLSVLDDVGGIQGYAEFLENVFLKSNLPTADTEEESESTFDSKYLLMWAKEHGWKTKAVSPQKML